MNNYTERTWTMVTMNEAIKNLVKTYAEHPPRKLQSMTYAGPITISDERFASRRIDNAPCYLARLVDQFPEPAWVPSSNNPQCFIGYRCKDGSDDF
jgi:hypothetical protein